MANANQKTMSFPAPAGYASSFAMPDATRVRVVLPASSGFMAISDPIAAAMVAVSAAKRVDYVPIGVGEVATVLMVCLVWRHLKRARERMHAIAADETTMHASGFSDDDQAKRIAFEARYSRENLS